MFTKYHVDTSDLSKKSETDGIATEFAISVTKLNDKRLICMHNVEGGKIQQGRPVDGDVLKDLLSELASDTPVEHWNNERVLYQRGNTLAWYRPASKQPEQLWFRTNKQLSVLAKLPTLIFVLSDQLYILACASKSVNRETKLYHAPLCNIHSNASLCFGSAERPDISDSVSVRMAKCEAALLATNFSHTSCDKIFKKLVGVSGRDTEQHIKIWQGFAAAGEAPKGRDMVSFGKTLEQFIKTLER
ncbi:MAG: hypothetical protein CML22_06885 [Rheinheimera sp.]|nr:hypothetical protein [Rheinheimera sp.]